MESGRILIGRDSSVLFPCDACPPDTTNIGAKHFYKQILNKVNVLAQLILEKSLRSFSHRADFARFFNFYDFFCRGFRFPLSELQFPRASVLHRLMSILYVTVSGSQS